MSKAPVYVFELDFFSAERRNAYAKYLYDAYEAAAEHRRASGGEVYTLPPPCWFRWVVQEALMCAAAALTRFGTVVSVKVTMFMQSDVACIDCGQNGRMWN